MVPDGTSSDGTGLLISRVLGCCLSQLPCPHCSWHSREHCMHLGSRVTAALLGPAPSAGLSLLCQNAGMSSCARFKAHKDYGVFLQSEMLAYIAGRGHGTFLPFLARQDGASGQAQEVGAAGSCSGVSALSLSLLGYGVSVRSCHYFTGFLNCFEDGLVWEQLFKLVCLGRQSLELLAQLPSCYTLSISSCYSPSIFEIQEWREQLAINK